MVRILLRQNPQRQEPDFFSDVGIVTQTFLLSVLAFIPEPGKIVIGQHVQCNIRLLGRVNFLPLCQSLKQFASHIGGFLFAESL
jgi:hypothetical protein